MEHSLCDSGSTADLGAEMSIVVPEVGVVQVLGPVAGSTTSGSTSAGG